MSIIDSGQIGWLDELGKNFDNLHSLNTWINIDKIFKIREIEEYVIKNALIEWDIKNEIWKVFCEYNHSENKEKQNSKNLAKCYVVTVSGSYFDKEGKEQKEEYLHARSLKIAQAKLVMEIVKDLEKSWEEEQFKKIEEFW